MSFLFSSFSQPFILQPLNHNAMSGSHGLPCMGDSVLLFSPFSLRVSFLRPPAPVLLWVQYLASEQCLYLVSFLGSGKWKAR